LDVFYEAHEWRHATAILKADFPEEWRDLVGVLETFRIKRSWINTPGGSKSEIARSIDISLGDCGWVEKSFETSILVDGRKHESPTHKVDCYKNRVALEVEWNNKDPFYDRDLNNFRLLHQLGAISVGIILTRCDELQSTFKELKRGSSYGMSTTHMSRLIPRIVGGGGGGCPVLALGMRNTLIIEG